MLSIEELRKKPELTTEEYEELKTKESIIFLNIGMAMGNSKEWLINKIKKWSCENIYRVKT